MQYRCDNFKYVVVLPEKWWYAKLQTPSLLSLSRNVEIFTPVDKEYDNVENLPILLSSGSLFDYSTTLEIRISHEIKCGEWWWMSNVRDILLIRLNDPKEKDNVNLPRLLVPTGFEAVTPAWER